jgi:hypothetical protein
MFFIVTALQAGHRLQNRMNVLESGVFDTD